MREIEFRIRYRDKTWYYGLPISKIKNDTVAFNAFDNSYYDLFADATTLGQYTGLTDKNGTKIFEGDLLYYRNYNHDEEDGAMEVVFEDGAFMISGDISVPLHELYSWELEVIGNVYDNGDFINEN